MPPRIRIRWASPQCPNSFQISSQITIRLPIRTQTRSIRSILKPPPKPSPYNQIKPPEAVSAAAAVKRREYTTPFRTGLLARKKGMSLTFDPTTGHETPCTILQVDRCQVVGHKTLSENGYWAVQVGFGWKHPNRLSPAMLGDYSIREVSPKEEVQEFKVRDQRSLLAVGTNLMPSWFKVGQLVDSRSKSKGKGFAGGMKRHGFKGQPASHGQSLTHRTMGSAGGSQGSGSRVLPGKRMPGRMGGQRCTVQHLRVLKIDDKSGVVVVKGAVSGPKNCIVQLQDSKKRPEQLEKLALPLIPLESFLIATTQKTATV